MSSAPHDLAPEKKEPTSSQAASAGFQHFPGCLAPALLLKGDTCMACVAPQLESHVIWGAWQHMRNMWPLLEAQTLSLNWKVVAVVGACASEAPQVCWPLGPRPASSLCGCQQSFFQSSHCLALPGLRTWPPHLLPSMNCNLFLEDCC